MGACMHLYFARTLIEQHLYELHIHVVFIIFHCILVLYMLFCIIMYSSYWTKLRNILLLLLLLLLLLIIIIIIIIIVVVVVQIKLKKNIHLENEYVLI